MKKIMFLFLLIMLSNGVYSQNKSMEYMLDSLNREITQINDFQLKNEYEKSYIIYLYIIKNFQYDDKQTSFIKGLNDSLRFKTMVSKKKGVCADFAILAYLLYNSNNIECKEISGNARSEYDFYKFSIDSGLHAWNKIRVNNKWLLIDCTWGACTYTVNKSIEYFNVQPELFITNHYPKNLEDALIENISLSFEEFCKLPILKNYYCCIKYVNDKIDYPKIQRNGDSIIIPPIQTNKLLSIRITTVSTNDYLDFIDDIPPSELSKGFKINLNKKESYIITIYEPYKKVVDEFEEIRELIIATFFMSSQ